jgi:hypothetical protein
VVPVCLCSLSPSCPPDPTLWVVFQEGVMKCENPAPFYLGDIESFTSVLTSFCLALFSVLDFSSPLPVSRKSSGGVRGDALGFVYVSVRSTPGSCSILQCMVWLWILYHVPQSWHGLVPVSLVNDCLP